MISQVLLFPTQRPGRKTHRQGNDICADKTFGDSIIFKAPGTSRFFFQNVKGLTHSSSKEDYKYFLSAMASYSVDIFGMAETNTGWQHKHLQSDFQACVKRQFQYGKTVFGYPSEVIDPLSEAETFQAGGTVQVVQGNITTSVHGKAITDPSGLGRWIGFSLMGKREQKFSVVTCYRSCPGSIHTAALGSTFHREYAHFRNEGDVRPNPRKRFFDDLSCVIRQLQRNDHSVMIMIDANSTLESDNSFKEFVDSNDLHDLHHLDPAPSTFIGAKNRRLDYILGCTRTKEAVSRQGTLSYFEGPQSDHRGLYVDIDLNELFGISVDDLPMTNASRRQLKGGNPETVQRYLASMRKYYEQHNMKERIDRLYNTQKTMTRSQVRTILMSWDNDQGRAMKTAEDSLAIRPKKYQWSPRLRNSAVIMRYWKLRLRELKYQENYQATFDRWERQIQAKDRSFRLPEKEQYIPIETVRQRLNQATRDLRATQKSATVTRSTCYYELLAKYADDSNEFTKYESKRKYQIVKRTIQSEEIKALHSKIRSVVKPSEFTALSRIQIPRNINSVQETKPGEVHETLNTAPENIIWDTVITRKQIEEHLVRFNKEAFRAAADSPCGHGLIHDALTFTSLSPEAETLLYGEVPTEWYGDNILLREFLASFRIPETVLSIDSISASLSEDDIKKGFKSWKESTTTSPSGRHLGHYKALIQDPLLLTCMCKFLNIAISRGISIPRWCQAVNVLIEKDHGQPRINRLRIIHLFEADYNLFLKIMWGSRLVQRAVHMDLLNPGQHGSVPGRTTMDPIMLNQLTTDMCRVFKINYARFDNDASACFDRIIVALGMLAARRCGMPKNAVRSHAKSLELMRYTVKTVYGISETSYSGTPFEPLFGTGQGSGASPAVWLTLVVILLNTLDRIIPDRISFRSPDGTLVHNRLVDAFVDDTALGFTDDGSRSIDQLVSSLETIAQTWEKLLHFSGGALNLSKCSWYAMIWDWKNGRPHLRDISSSDPEVHLTQGSSATPVTIKRQDLTQSTRILGVHQNPIGDFHDHVSVLNVNST
ncbi:hypothetical protein MHU86_3154 [Fragilaria crotonensis]|nr:hypothetical protein MHU86_3154 [Fragilaria crotonensis]